MTRPLQRQVEWCQKVQWLLAGAIALFFCGFYFLGYRATTQRLNALRAEIQVKQRDLVNNELEAKKLPYVAAAVFNLQSRVDKFDKKLPKQQELPQFIRDITQVSQQASLKKIEVKPGIGRKGELFSEMPITLTFEGDFLSVASFLRQTEQMQRLTRVHGMTVKTKSGKPGEVEVQVSMNIYFSEG